MNNLQRAGICKGGVNRHKKQSASNCSSLHGNNCPVELLIGALRPSWMIQGQRGCVGFVSETMEGVEIQHSFMQLCALTSC